MPDAGLEAATLCLQVRCYTNCDNHADSSANNHMYLDLATLMDVVIALPSPSIIFSKLKEAST